MAKRLLRFDCSLLQLSHKLTSIGLEVENIRSPITDPDKFIVCEVIRVEKHPNADKLKFVMFQMEKIIIRLYVERKM